MAQSDESLPRDDRGIISRGSEPGTIVPEPGCGDFEAQLSDGNASFELGADLERQGQLEAAQVAYRQADENGHPAAACNLGVLLEQRGDREAAKAAYRRADGRGDAKGTFNLGALLEEEGELAGAEVAYRRADRRGHAAAASNLGVLLAEKGDTAGAEAAFRRAEQRGYAEAAFNLAVLLKEKETATDGEQEQETSHQDTSGAAPDRPAEYQTRIQRPRAEVPMMRKPDQAPSNVPKLALTVKEACEALGVSWSTWRQHIEPDIRMVRIGARKVIPVSELRRWLDCHARSTL
jgi:TPR repeat protein